MADTAKIKRNVAKMVSMNAPEADIDAYISSEGVTLDDVRAAKTTPGPSAAAVADADKLKAMGVESGMGHRVADNVTFGAFNPVMGALGATAKTVGKALTGQETNWTGDYQHERDVLDEQLRRSREGSGLGGTAAEIALSLPFTPVQKAAQAAQAAPGIIRQGLDAAKAGAIYSGLYGFNSARGGIGDHLESTAGHAAAGAVLGPAFAGGVNLLARAPNAIATGTRYVTGRSPEAVQQVQNNLADAASAGVREFGPAATDNRLLSFASQKLANRPFVGAPLRAEAGAAIDDVTAQAQRAINTRTGNQPINDIGADVQQTLRNNLIERSTPSRDIRGMDDDALRAVTGEQRLTQPGDYWSFRPGRSKESYPTEFDAAYERATRATPDYRRNPMGGNTAEGRAAQTATKSLVDDLAEEGRRSLQIKGAPFDESGAMSPELTQFLKGRLGNDIAEQLAGLTTARAGHVATTPRALRELRTHIRRAAQAAEKPPFPALPRTDEAAALRRLEGALSEDMQTFAKQSGGPARSFQTETREGRYVDPQRPGATQLGDAPPSDATVYVRPEHLERLTGSKMPNDHTGRLPATRSLVLDGNGLAMKRNDVGQIDAASRVPFSNKPEPGLRPVQIWEDGRVSYGAPITSRGATPGEAAAAGSRNIDQRYAEYITELRKPLGKVFGEKTAPIEALDRLVTASKEGDLTVLRPFMQVMREKGDPAKGAASIIAHATQKAENFNSFLSGYRSISPDAKKILASTPESRALFAQLDLLERQAAKLEPFQSAIDNIAKHPGLRPGHIPMGAAFYYHFAPALIGYAGAAGMAKFMSSPRYVAWLTKAAQLKSPGQWTNHVRTLTPAVERDSEYGANIRKAVDRAGAEILGIKPANAMFIGEKADGANQEDLQAAKKDAQAGISADVIWKKYGWYKGGDGKWRGEIDDSRAQLAEGAEKLLKTRRRVETTVGAVLDHEDLYQAYPSLDTMRLIIDPSADIFAAYGEDEAITVGKKGLANPAMLKDSILHEGQHGIQRIEGFAYGKRTGVGNLASYMKRPGEAEAYNVEYRAKMSEDQRRETPPWKTTEGRHDGIEWKGAMPLDGAFRSAGKMAGEQPQAAPPSAQGGDVPKGTPQDVASYIEAMEERTGKNLKNFLFTDSGLELLDGVIGAQSPKEKEAARNRLLMMIDQAAGNQRRMPPAPTNRLGR